MPDDLVLTRSAQEGVDLLAGIVERGDPEVYQEVQALLLSDTPTYSPEDGPEVNHIDQTPGPWPLGSVRVD